MIIQAVAFVKRGKLRKFGVRLREFGGGLGGVQKTRIFLKKNGAFFYGAILVLVIWSRVNAVTFLQLYNITYIYI